MGWFQSRRGFMEVTMNVWIIEAKIKGADWQPCVDYIHDTRREARVETKKLIMLNSPLVFVKNRYIFAGRKAKYRAVKYVREKEVLI